MEQFKKQNFYFSDETRFELDQILNQIMIYCQDESNCKEKEITSTEFIVKKLKDGKIIDDYLKSQNIDLKLSVQYNKQKLDKIILKKSKKQNEKILQEIKKDEKPYGFSIIIKMIVEQKVPIILHNGFYDILYIYDQFITDLPDSLESFQKEILKSFPFIYDNKVIAENYKIQNPNKKIRTSLVELQSLMNISNNQTNHSYLKQYHNCKIMDDNRFQKYLGNGSFFHEAAYDSYITGSSFIAIQYLNLKQDQVLKTKLDNKQQFPFLNEIYFFKQTENLNLQTSQKNDEQNHCLRFNHNTLYFTADQKISIDEVSKLFQFYGDFNIMMVTKKEGFVNFEQFKKNITITDVIQLISENIKCHQFKDRKQFVAQKIKF